MITESEIPSALGAPLAGGFFTGRFILNGEQYALISAPKATGSFIGPWNESSENVPGAQSYCDGMANTIAMAEAGSLIARDILALEIDGITGWHWPSQDEVELQYRAFKPTTDENTLYGRSGLNAAAIPSTHPYSATEPAQTAADAFREGGEQAFEDEWHWSSTQHAVSSDYAWGQSFGNGLQDGHHKSASGRVRAVRKLKIQ